MSSMSTAELIAQLDGPVHGLSDEQYGLLVDHGLLEDARVELLRGMIVEMSPTTRPHGLAVQWLNMWFARRLSEDLHVRVQSGLSALPDSVPEPDLAVVPAAWASSSGTPHPGEALLVVEVAESSLRRDLGIKAGIYAEAGVVVYWVLDLMARQMVVHTQPVEGRYDSVQRVGIGAVLEAAGVEVPLAELLAFAFA
jgi:Uma2 family endonuclease